MWVPWDTGYRQPMFLGETGGLMKERCLCLELPGIESLSSTTWPHCTTEANKGCSSVRFPGRFWPSHTLLSLNSSTHGIFWLRWFSALMFLFQYSFLAAPCEWGTISLRGPDFPVFLLFLNSQEDIKRCLLVAYLILKLWIHKQRLLSNKNTLLS